MGVAYKVKEVRDTNFTDPHGNHWLNAAFEGFGEPVSLVVKDPSKINVGTELVGEIKQVPKKNGEGTYNRFFRDKPNDFGGHSQGNSRPQYQPRDDAAIQAQWAIGQAREAALLESDDPNYYAEVKDIAQHFFAMIEEVKAGPKEINQWDVKQAAETLAVTDADKPVDVSDIPF